MFGFFDAFTPSGDEASLWSVFFSLFRLRVSIAITRFRWFRVYNTCHKNVRHINEGKQSALLLRRSTVRLAFDDAKTIAYIILDRVWAISWRTQCVKRRRKARIVSVCYCGRTRTTNRWILFFGSYAHEILASIGQGCIIHISHVELRVLHYHIEFHINIYLLPKFSLLNSPCNWRVMITVVKIWSHYWYWQGKQFGK